MTLQDILAELYGINEWAFHNRDGTGEDYADLEWLDAAAKPTEAAIRARDAEATAARAAKLDKERAQRVFQGDAPDALMVALEIIGDYMAETYRVLPAASRTSFNSQILSRAQTLRQRLTQIRSG